MVSVRNKLCSSSESPSATTIECPMDFPKHEGMTRIHDPVHQIKTREGNAVFDFMQYSFGFSRKYIRQSFQRQIVFYPLLARVFHIAYLKLIYINILWSLWSRTWNRKDIRSITTWHFLNTLSYEHSSLLFSIKDKYICFRFERVLFVSLWWLLVKRMQKRFLVISSVFRNA